MFDPALAVAGNAGKRTVSPAGTAGDGTAPVARGSTFQLLLDAPSEPTDGSLETVPATGRSTPGPAVVPSPRSRSSALEPVLAVATQASTAPALPSEVAVAPSSSRRESASARSAAPDAQPAPPERNSLANLGTEGAASSAASAISPEAAVASSSSRRESASARSAAPDAQPAPAERNAVANLGTEGAASPAAFAISPEAAVASSSSRRESASARSAAGNVQVATPRRTPVVAAEGAAHPAASSSPALLPDCAVPSQSKNQDTAAWAADAEAAGNASSAAASAGVPRQNQQNPASLKAAVAPDNSGPAETVRSAAFTARRGAPQNSSVQPAATTGETPALTPPPFILPVGPMDPGAARSNSSPARQPVDRHLSRDRAATTSSHQADVPSAPSPQAALVAPLSAAAQVLPPTQAEAGEVSAPSDAPSEPHLATGGDRGSPTGPQYESLRRESSGKPAPLAGPLLSPVARWASSAPLAFQARLTPHESKTLAAFAVSVGPVPAPYRSPTASYRESNPPAAGASVSGDPARPGSASGQAEVATADRDSSVADDSRPDRPQTASNSRGASRPEPAETAAPPAEPLTTEAGNLLSAMAPSQPPLRPAVPTIAGDSPAPPRPPAEAGAPAASSATTVNRGIQLQVRSGAGGVAVRVTERAGEVRVDVRTPDSQLTSALRQELPALATRFAESGFHAAIWHPASASTMSPNAADKGASANADGQGGQKQGRRQQQQQQQPPDQRLGQSSQSPETDTNRKDFQWLFTSLP